MVRTLSTALDATRNRFRSLVAAWVRRRQGTDALPRTLLRNRLYILPTKVATVFGGILFVMLLGSMNYSNSMGLALTFMLASLGLIAMHNCHRNLLELVVTSVSATPVFADSTARFCVRIRNASPRKRYQVRVRIGDYSSDVQDIPSASTSGFIVEVPAATRGVLRIGRLSVTSTHPFSFFRCWTWLHMDMECLVYPQPATSGIAPPQTDVDVGGALHEGPGNEDFAGLRPYRAGDSPRHIAWKAFARDNTLLVKQFTGTSLTTRWLDMDQAPGPGVEERLSLLCRWVLAAEAQGFSYGLRLPAMAVEPGCGRGQQARCLEALARYGDPARGDTDVHR